MSINLGVQWDAAADLSVLLETQQQRQAKRPQKDNSGPKVTPAQYRDNLFGELAEAITQSDLDRVKEILLDNPKLAFNIGATDQMHIALLKNFDRAIADTLKAREFKMGTYTVYQHLLQSHDPALLQYLIDDVKENNNPYYMVNLYANTFKGFGQLPERRRLELRAQREMIDAADDTVAQKCMNNPQFRMVFTAYTSALPASERATIQSLHNADWEKVFTAWLNDLYKERNFHEITPRMFKSLLDFCNDFPFVQKGWDASMQKLATQNAEYRAFMDTYFDAETFSDSTLYKTVDEQQKANYAGRRREVEFVKFWNKNYAQLGWSDRDLARLVPLWPSYYFKENVPLKFNEVPNYTPATFAHILVFAGSEASRALLESETGRSIYQECLKEKEVFGGWCKNASPDLIAAVLRACPSLREWIDDNKNTIAHYLVYLRQESTKTFGQMLARVNHNWLLEANDKGVSVKDLFKMCGAKMDTLNALDNESIKRAIKDAGIKKNRVEHAPKRRM